MGGGVDGELKRRPGYRVTGCVFPTNLQRHALAPKHKDAARLPEFSGRPNAASVAPYKPVKYFAGTTQSRRVRFGDKVLACLLADAQLPDHIAVAVRVVGLQVIQQATALAHQHQ